MGRRVEKLCFLAEKQIQYMLKQKGVLSKNYLLLWSGQLVSQMGIRLYLMALSWYFVSELGDNTALFLVFIFSSLPSLLFGAFVGPLIERWNKKHIMIGCDFICAALVGVLAWLVSINEAHNYIIYAVCFLLNTMNLFFSPSLNSMIPSILDEDSYQQGMSYMKMITFLGQIMGAAVGGLLVGFFGVYLTILINAISFFISGLAEIFITYKPEIVQKTGSYISDLKSGLKYAWSDKTVRSVLTVSIACNLFIPTFMVFLPIVIKTHLGLDARHYGFADAMMPMGAVVMAVFLSKVKFNLQPLQVLAMGIGGLAVAFMLTVFLPYYPVIMFSVFCYGCFTNFINIQVITYFLHRVDKDFRGRFFSILESFSFASISISYVLSTILSSQFDTKIAILINAVCLIIITLTALMLQRSVERVKVRA